MKMIRAIRDELSKLRAADPAEYLRQISESGRRSEAKRRRRIANSKEAREVLVQV